MKSQFNVVLTRIEGKRVKYLYFYISGFRLGVHSRTNARRPDTDNTGADFMLIDSQRQSTTQQPTSPDGLPRLDGVI